MKYIGLGKAMLTVVMLVSVCGCVSIDPNTFTASAPVSVPAVTTTPPIPSITPEYFPVTITSAPTTIVTTIPTSPTIPPTKTYTPVRTATPHPMATMQISEPYYHYLDSDFSVKYPSNWTVETTAIPIEPSRMNFLDTFRGSTRQVVFSGSPSVKFVVETTDLAAPGTGRLQPEFPNCADEVQKKFPDVGGRFVISHYSKIFTPMYKSPAVVYDVNIPEASTFYPLAYTEIDAMTEDHYHVFRFSTPGNLDQYSEIKQNFFDTLQYEL